jgi:hypothetical protein
MSRQLYILNADNSINWEKYKEYTEHYHNQHCPLSKPYTEEELRAICVEKKIELPEELFNYLTKVSNTVYIEGYASTSIFDLSDSPSKEYMDKICIPLDKIDITKKKEKIEDYNNYEKVFIRISDLGCAHSIRMYLGAGEHYGSIWYNECSDWEGFTKRHKSFTEYIIKNFDKRYMYNIDDLEDEGNYPVDSATEKHNEDTRKMTIEIIDKVYAEYLEKHKDSIYIPRKPEEWKTLADGEDWTY